MSTSSSFDSQLALLTEVAKLKQVLRHTRLIHGDRNENAAEHSWHLILSAILLAEHAAAKIDLLKVIKMLAIHDLGEIELGDTLHYLKPDAIEDEENAIATLLKDLPHHQKEELLSLWQEFNQRQTSEAKFAAALDRMWPIIQNCNHAGGSWKEFGITAQMTLDKNQHVGHGSPQIWSYLTALIDQAGKRSNVCRRHARIAEAYCQFWTLNIFTESPRLCLPKLIESASKH